LEHLSFERQHDLFSARRDFEKLVSTGILSAAGSESPWFEPVITQLLILLADLMKAANQMGQRCQIKDDILCIDQKMALKINDLTDLIVKCRDVSCHISSGNAIFETNKFKFCKIVGLCPNAFFINGHVIGCDYEDDIAIIWGPMRLYLKRNLIRAFQEVAPLFPDPFDHPSPPTNFSNR
jgi:hypothetical protein